MKDEYLLAAFGNGKFFCYLGCRFLFDTKLGVMKHYVERHYFDEDKLNLKKWGLSYDSLELQVNAWKSKEHKKTEAILAKRREIKAEIKQAAESIIQRHKNQRFSETIETPAQSLSKEDCAAKSDFKRAINICDQPKDQIKK